MTYRGAPFYLVLALVLVLLAWTPVAAVPVAFGPQSNAFLVALSCGWFAPLALSPGPFAPACGGLEVAIALLPGDPTVLFGTFAFYPDGFESHQAKLVSQEIRTTVGGEERFSITPVGSGDYFFALALPVEAHIYFFELLAPPPGIPLEPVPEPATLLLWGTSAAGLTLARWYRRRPAHAA